jgi:ATP-dependent RNA helicase RhlE
MEKQEENGFAKFNFNKQLESGLEKQGWEKPSPIQEKTIPVVKAGKDVVGIAQTGTGKTAAFLLPLIAKLHYPQGMLTRALILAPTKELVAQIGKHFEDLNEFVGLRACLLVGGIGPKKQLEQLLAGNDLVISTPGRFLELYASNEWKIKDIKTLVIDEADRMMDMGFMPQIRRILEKLPRKRQNLLFSATFPESVEKMVAEFLEFPERVEVTEQASVAPTIEQLAFKTKNFQTKLNLIQHLLVELSEEQTAMVFVKTKQHATEIGKFLDRKLNHKVAFLHANKGTNTRMAALESLHTKEIQILVSTDVAARGLDVSSVSLVINFDLPIKYEEYVHRIGRTGRANRLGKAISFVDPPDELHWQRIEGLIKTKISFSEVPSRFISEKTPFEETQDQLKKLDLQKRKADPDFKGSFHEKKLKNAARKPDKKKSSNQEKGKSMAWKKPKNQSPKKKPRG